MGIGSLINYSNTNTATGAIDYEPMDAFEATGETWNYFKYNFNSNSQARLERKQIDQQEDALKNILGQDVINIIGEENYNSDRRFSVVDEFIQEQREKGDKRFDAIRTSDEMIAAAKEEARQIGIDYERKMRGASGFERVVGGLSGGVFASLEDPVVLGTAAAGVGASAALRFKTALQVVAFETGLGIASEAALQPFVANWQKEIGNQYGLGDALTNIAFAGVASAGLSAVGSGLARQGLNTLRNKSSFMFEAVADAPTTPKYLKQPLREVAEAARVKETNVFAESSPSALAAHQRNVDAIDDAIKNKRPLQNVELDLTTAKLADDVPQVRAVDDILNQPKLEEDFTAQDYRNQQRVLEEQEALRIESVEAERFKSLAQDKPDTKIQFEDGTTTTIAEINREVTAAQKIYNAVKACSI